MGSVLKPAAATAAILAVCSGLAFAGTATIGPSTALADTGCADYFACFWLGSAYGADRVMHQASDCSTGTCPINANNQYASAKNRYSNRRVRVYAYLGVELVACLDPGENRPSLTSPPVFWYNPGPPDSRCP
jgi:hypothetical protein